MRTSLKIVFAVFLLLAGAGEVAYRVSYNAMAESLVQPASHQLSIEEAVPNAKSVLVERENLSPQQDVSPIAEESQQSVVSSVRSRLPEQVPVNAIIDEFRNLYTRFSKQYIRPGWLHLVYQEEHPSSKDPIDTEYGLTIPPTYIFDTWYQLNGSGQVVQGVTLMRNTSGQIIQVSVYRDRIWHNLTIEENMSVDNPPSVRLDGRFLLHLEEAYNKGAQLTKTEVLSKGENLIRFTYEEVYDTPTLISSSPKPMQQVRRSAYVDPDNSHLMILETVFTTTSGEELVTLRTTLLTIENVNKPPDEVLSYLEQVK